MRLDPVQARERFALSPVLRLATVSADGRPHVVPCTFALDAGQRVVIGIDDKPKESVNLRRLANIAGDPRVSLLADHYAGDWTQLWWARADGLASVERSGQELARHWAALADKYPQYAGRSLAGPVIVVTVQSWSGWAFAGL